MRMPWNPLLGVHLRLSGTPRTHVTMVVVFVLLAGIGATISYRAAPPREWGSVSAFWLGIVSAAQAFFLLLMTPGAIRKAVLRDFQTGMIESHRLSPMSAAKVVLGYVTGPPVQSYVLYATSLVIGGVFAAHYANSTGTGLVVTGWYAGQAILIIQALALTSLVLIIALTTSGKTNLLGPLIAISAVSGWQILPLVPGMALLLGVFSAQRIFSIVTASKFAVTGGGGGSGDIVMVIAPVLQLVLAAICLRASARKIRSPEGPPFASGLALCLAVFWATTSIIGLTWADVSTWFFARETSIRYPQLLLSTASIFVMSQFAVVAGAFELMISDRKRALGEPISKASRVAHWLMPLALAGITIAALAIMLLGMPTLPMSRPLADGDPARWAMVFAAFVLGYVIDFSRAYAAALRGGRLIWPTLFSLSIKFGPIGIDALMNAVAMEANPSRDFAFTWLSACSPIGIILCVSNPALMATGLAVQAGLAAGFAALAWAAHNRFKKAPVTFESSRPARPAAARA
ncbi:MAG: hypothetical protein U1D55_10765 [Phycisphaerae bacterium]